MLAGSEEQIETAPALLHPGKDEMNFAEFPIALLTDRVPKGQTSIKFEDQVYDEQRKKLVPRKRLIEGSQEYGLPTATDDKVILALIQLTKQKNEFTRREVEFTRLELIQLLGWANEGKSYDRIKLSLIRIKGVNYTYDNAWWDPRQKKWTTRAFSILDNVEINDSRASGGQNGLFPSRITWNEIVFDSFQAGFLRNVDFSLCMRLEHAISLRMYRFLGKRFYVGTDLTFDLNEFVIIHLNLGRNYEGGAQISRKLKPAIRELERVGFLEPLDDKERFPKKGREWLIRFVQKTTPAALPTAPSPSGVAPDKTELPPLVTELISRGVGTAKAAGLVKRHAAESIAAKIEIFDWLVAKQDKRVAKNPAGYLLKSIEDGYVAPKDFVSRVEQQRLKEERQAKSHRADEERRRKRQEVAQEQADRDNVNAYLKQLAPGERAKLEATVLAQASQEAKASYDDPVMARFRESLMLGMLREYLAPRLRNRKLQAIDA